MKDRFNLNAREVAIAASAQKEFERRHELVARLREDRCYYDRLHIKLLVELEIIEIQKESYGTYSVRRGPAWEEFYSEYGLQATRESLQRIEFGERFDRELGPMIDDAFNPNVLPFRRPLHAPIRN